MADTENHSNDLFLVDGSGFIFRAYYAIPGNMTNPDGVPINAAFGFVNMLVKLLIDLNAPSVAVVFDAARENFRNDIYADYKANRDETPEDLIPQFPIIRDAVGAFALPCIELEGYEADDLIATYARLAREQGRNVTIVSSDKDLMQLVRDGVKMFDPMKSKWMGEEDVLEKFGVPPEKVVDVQALAGDSTDNVPGVPGIGIKTAAQLIAEYGDLETLLKRAGEIKQNKRRESLVEHADMARISKQLVKLDDHVPVPMSLEDLDVHEPDHRKLLDFLKTQGFRTTITRLEKRFTDHGMLTADEDQDTPAATAPASPGKKGYELVQDEAALKRWIAAAHETGVVAIDTETTSLTPAWAELVGISLSTAPGNGCYIPLAHKSAPDGELDLGNTKKDTPKQLALDKVVKLLKPLLEDPAVLKVGHNIKYDLQMFEKTGIFVTPIDDTMLMSYIVDGTTHGHGMDELADSFLDHTTIKYQDLCGKGKTAITIDHAPLDRVCDYAAEDADITLQLHNVFKPRLIGEHMVTVYETIERPLIPVIARMELNGIKVDPAILRQMSNDFSKKLNKLEKEVYKLAGREFNVGSPRQLGEVLFQDMGLESGKKTKSGQYSTDVRALEDLSLQGHVIADKILDWRQLSKLKSTYTDALPDAINPKTGRVHTSFHMAGTNTGRLSSSDPNLQNIPIRTEEGRKIRTAFIAEKGNVLLSVDYSQVELRLAAELAGVEALKDAFRHGEDIHALTASQVFGVPLKDMTPEIRNRAKAINFGIIYGISGFGLAKQLKIPPGEASDYIKHYLERFPEIPAYMERMKEFAREHDYVETLYGRKIFIPDIKSKNGAIRSFAERQSINAPLQGTAADIMKRAMVRIPPALTREKLGAIMVLQVHDELIFEVPKKEVAETAALVKHVMEERGHFDVPLVADANWGDNWNDAH